MLNTNDSTLSQMAAFLTNTCNSNVSPQAVDQRIKTAGKEFLKICLNKAFSISLKRLNINNKILNTCDHLYIIDSTNFDLHPKLSDIFKGSSGGASKSSLRIQFVYDFLTGNMYIQIGDVKLSDAKTFYRIIKDNSLDVSGKSLFLADLGYFKTDSFLHIAKNADYFVSKLKSNILIYDENNNKLDISDLFKKQSRINMTVKIGCLTCRLVGEKLPDNIVNEKLRKALKEAHKKKRTLSEKSKVFIKYALFITNFEETTTFDSLFCLYRIRWQIELIFKTWKSIIGIHKIRSANEKRILCEIYGKLIIAVLTNVIYWKIKLEYGIVLSYHKVLQHIKAIAVNWTVSILKNKDAHFKFLNNLKLQILRLCKKNRQSNKPYIEIILGCMDLLKIEKVTP
jgi:hypothetical protein